MMMIFDGQFCKISPNGELLCDYVDRGFAGCSDHKDLFISLPFRTLQDPTGLTEMALPQFGYVFMEVLRFLLFPRGVFRQCGIPGDHAESTRDARV